MSDPDTTSDPLKLNVVMGSCERRGAWNVPSRVEAYVKLGNMELDLRDAKLGPETTIDALFRGQSECFARHASRIQAALG